MVNYNRGTQYLQVINDWPYDDWSISKECFEKIVSILPFDSTILELGSGRMTELFSKFYNVYTVEQDEEWVDHFPDPTYFHVPVKEMETIHFGLQSWYDTDILKEKLQNISYDLLLIDGPKGRRGGFLDQLELFDNNVVWVFDDTMDLVPDTGKEVLNSRVFKICKELTGRHGETFQCAPNPRATCWVNGKRFSVLYV